MSDRFSDCETVAEALRRYRDMEVVDADDDFELTVRLRQLAPRVPRAVDEAGRERARSAMARILNDAALGRTAPEFEVIDRSLDRIIDALGYTVAPKPERARDYFDTLVVPADAPHQCADVQDDCCERTPAPATPTVDDLACNGVACGDCYRVCKTGSATPAVELTPDELRSAAAIVEAFRELHTQTCKLNYEAVDAVPSTWPLPIIDAQLPVAVVCGEADWVLRIGGTDE